MHDKANMTFIHLRKHYIGIIYNNKFNCWCRPEKKIFTSKKRVARNYAYNSLLAIEPPKEKICMIKLNGNNENNHGRMDLTRL